MNFSLIPNLYFVFEAIVLLLSILFWKKIRSTNISLLSIYVLLIFICDMYAFYRKANGQSNFWINDIVIPFEFLFLSFYYYKTSKKPLIRKTIIILAASYFLVYLIDEFFYRHTYPRLYLRSYLTGVIMILIIVIMYYYELLNSQRLYKFYFEPEFWVSSGILLFYLGTLPFHLAWNISAVKFFKVYISTKNIFYILICIMYLFFSIGILCLKQKDK
jgi:hypothetical protein